MQGELIPRDVYCCDANCLINLRQAGLIQHVRRLVLENRIKIPQGIYGELKKRSEIGKLIERWDRKHNHQVIVDIDNESRVLELLPEIERKYGPPFQIGGISYEGFWKGDRDPKSKDGQVVALAKARGWVVISNDRCVHGACLHEKVSCLHWEELARKELIR